MAVVWRRMCGEIRRPRNEGHPTVALRTACASCFSRPKRERRAPNRLTNTGVEGSVGSCSSQWRNCREVFGQRGTVRCLRPLPSSVTAWQQVLAIERDDFRGARPGVIEQLKQESVTSSAKGIWSGGLQNGLDLWGGQIAQQWTRLAFVRDG